MGSLKSSDASSATPGKAPKSAKKKANEKATSPASRPQDPDAEATPPADMVSETAEGSMNDAAMDNSATSGAATSDTAINNSDADSRGTNGKDSEVYLKKLGTVKAPLSRKSTKKSSTRQLSDKRSKLKSAAKPIVSAASDSVTSAETTLSMEDETFSFSGVAGSAVDDFVKPTLSTKSAKKLVPPFSLPQSYQSVNQNSDRIAIFIDGSNLFYAASHLNIEVDYRRLLSSLVRGRRLLRAYFYTGVDPQNEKQRGFLLWLNRHGHRVVSKELTQLPDGSRKANMHVEMAVDMMRISEYCQNITLLGGDGNLAYALETLSRGGTFIEVVSLQSMTSDSLIDLADSYTDLADLRDDIKR